jgi:hypothetical protein
MTNQNTNVGLFSELSCLLICGAVVWTVLLPGVEPTDVTPGFASYIGPLILLIAGVIGMIFCSLPNQSNGG